MKKKDYSIGTNYAAQQEQQVSTAKTETSNGNFHLCLFCKQVRNNNEEKYSCSLWGHTCDGLDFITKHCVLPKLEVGEWVFLESTYIYACTMSLTLLVHVSCIHIYFTTKL